MKKENLFIGFLIVVLTIILVFALFFSGRWTGDKLEYLLTYLPDEGITSIMYVAINEDGMGEMRENMGPFGSEFLKSIEGIELASSQYENNDTITVAIIKTKESMEDLVETYSTIAGIGHIDKKWIEEKEINGRTIYVGYPQYDTKKENPTCMWKESSGIGIMVVRPTSFWDYNIKNNCMDILEKTYKNENALKLLEKSSKWTSNINMPSLGKAVGEARMRIANKSIAVKAYSDEDGYYVISFGDYFEGSFDPLSGIYFATGLIPQEAMAIPKNLCYGDSENATIIDRVSKHACKKEHEGYGYKGPITSISMRRIGTNDIMVSITALVRGGTAKKVEERLEDVVFSIDLGAEDTDWRKDRDVTITAYVVSQNYTRYGDYVRIGTNKEPLSGVEAKLYVKDYYGSDLGTLRETKYTDADGKVTFKNCPMDAKIVLSKEGYAPPYFDYGDNYVLTVTPSMQKEVNFEKRVQKNLSVATTRPLGDDKWMMTTQDECSSATIENDTIKLVSGPDCEHTGVGVWIVENFTAKGKYNISFVYRRSGDQGSVGANGIFIAEESALLNNRETTFYDSIVSNAIFVSLGRSCALYGAIGVLFDQNQTQWHCDWKKEIAKNKTIGLADDRSYNIFITLDWDNKTIAMYVDGKMVVEGSIEDTLPVDSPFKIELHLSHYPHSGGIRQDTYEMFSVKKA